MLGLIYHFRRDVVREGEGIGLGDPVVAPRRVIALPTDARQRQRLLEISRSRTEPTGRVERARIILAYLDDPSAYAVARAIGVTQQTVTRCLERAAELGVIEALDEMGRASGVEDLHNFIQAVIQSEQFGTGIGKILRIQADEMRRKRRQRAQERGAQATLKMMLPMVGCIFPTLWIVLLGPAVLILMAPR